MERVSQSATSAGQGRWTKNWKPSLVIQFISIHCWLTW